MNAVFYIAAAVAVASTAMVVTRMNAVHSLLYLIVSLLAVSLIYFVLGAPFIAALEVIIYAGAIMVLFIYVIMMLNIGPETVAQEKTWLSRGRWWGPGILAGILVLELLYVIKIEGSQLPGTRIIEPKEVSTALFQRYGFIVELASMLLLAGLIGAFHLGRRDLKSKGEQRP